MITIFIGSIGSGKSLSTAILTELFRKNFIKKKIINQLEIYGNIEYKYQTNNLDFYFLNSKKINENGKWKILQLDEIQFFLESRRSMSDKNIRFSNSIKTSRHNKIEIIGNTQRLKSVDVNVRALIKYLINPSIENGKLIWNITDVVSNQVFTKTFSLKPNAFKLYNSFSQINQIKGNYDDDLSQI